MSLMPAVIVGAKADSCIGEAKLLRDTHLRYARHADHRAAPLAEKQRLGA